MQEGDTSTKKKWCAPIASCFAAIKNGALRVLRYCLPCFFRSQETLSPPRLQAPVISTNSAQQEEIEILSSPEEESSEESLAGDPALGEPLTASEHREEVSRTRELLQQTRQIDREFVNEHFQNAVPRIIERLDAGDSITPEELQRLRHEISVIRMTLSFSYDVPEWRIPPSIEPLPQVQEEIEISSSPPSTEEESSLIDPALGEAITTPEHMEIVNLTRELLRQTREINTEAFDEYFQNAMPSVTARLDAGAPVTVEEIQALTDLLMSIRATLSLDYDVPE